MKNIFLHTECPPDSTLIAYHKNELKAVEQNSVEQHLLQCEMCSDFMEGLQNMKNVEQLPKINSAIHSKIDKRIADKKRKYFIGRAKYVGMAASLVLLVGLAIFFGKNLNNSQKMAKMESAEQMSNDFDNSKKIIDETDNSKNENSTMPENEEIVSDNSEELKTEEKQNSEMKKEVADLIVIVEDTDDETDFELDFEFDDEEIVADIPEENKDKKIENDETLIADDNLGEEKKLNKNTAPTNPERAVVTDQAVVTGTTTSRTNSLNFNINPWKRKNSKTATVQEQPEVTPNANTSDMIYYARNFMNTGDYSSSLEYYNIILEDPKNPNYHEAKYNKAKILAQQNQTEQALELLRQLAEEKNTYQDSAKIMIEKIENPSKN